MFESEFQIGNSELEEGYAYLEEVMKGAQPGLGYSMLAQILADTRHQVVITTNFDNLVADSVLLFTNTFAQSVGHESLTGFIRVETRRPLVAKIHRDLLLGPQSDPDQTTLLHEDWARALRKLFTRHTPLFVGYGGNDGSLMNFLYRLRPGEIPGGIFWCYREGDEKPSKRILNLVARHKGNLVSITDFDVFMTQLAEPLGLGLIDTAFQEQAAERAKQLRKAWDHVKQGLGDKASLQKVAFEKVEKRRAIQKKDWWAWELETRAEQDPHKRESIYREGLKQFPDSLELTVNFAVFMDDIRKDYDEAERLYRKALDLDPNDVDSIGNFANFLHETRKDYDGAEPLYRKALDLDPDSPINKTNYLGFLIATGRFGEAKELSDGLRGKTSAEVSGLTPVVALLRGLLLLFDGKADVEALSRLKTSFQEGLHDERWSTEGVVSEAPRLDADNKKLYSAIGEAIRDANKVAALDEFPRWKAATPIPFGRALAATH